MKVAVFAVSLLSLSAVAGEYQAMVGLGHQYGGVLGAQFAYQAETTKYYGSVGLIGAAVGFQTVTTLTSPHAFGLVIGREELQSEDGFAFVTYDYHVNGFANPGWVIGTGLGVTREDAGGLFGDNGKKDISPALTLTLGYQF